MSTKTGQLQNLGLTTVAEGVETQDVRDTLRRNGCSAYQGFYYAQPLPIEELKTYMQKH